MNNRTLLAALLSTTMAAAISLCVQTSAAAEGLSHPDAPVGDAFMRDINDPRQLAGIIEDDLKMDPEGVRLLNATKCHQIRMKSCATAYDYFAAFQKADPDAGLKSVADLPAFLRSLVLKEPQAGTEYWMAALVPKGDDVFDVVVQGISRQFGPGEKAWADPRTGKIVLAQNCTNPVAGVNDLAMVVVGHECATIEWNSDERDENRVGILAPEAVSPSRCWRLQLADGEVFEGIKNFPHECDKVRLFKDTEGRVHTVHCDFQSDIQQVTTLTGASSEVAVQVTASFVSNAKGKNVLTVPSYLTKESSFTETVICRRSADQVQYMAEGVRAPMFRHWRAAIEDQYWQVVP